jgi:hypothetical protein
LAFVLNFAATLAWPKQLADDPVLAGRGVRWTLHRIACALAPITSDDPAALAFCGLLPGSAPPDAGEPPPTAAESAAIEKWRERVVAALTDRLINAVEAPIAGDAAALVEWVCHRNAEIVADPGWLEIHFAADSVSTELRRCGLDINPGWLPWLGLVVKFVYV